jgi:hypothetical protein
VKKILLMFVLFAVTFQSAWAANGAYCRHEEGAAAFHFGHHTHRHRAPADAGDKVAASGNVHFDCSACHSAAAALATAPAPPGAGLAPGLHPHPVAAVLYTSHIPEGPRRPDRFPAV